MSQIGPSAHSITVETLAHRIEYDSISSFAANQFVVCNLSGIAAAPEFDMDSDFSQPVEEQIRLSKFAPAIGEWTAVAERTSPMESKSAEYVICNDEYGYSPIFYSHIPGKSLIVSDSFHGVAYELMRNGVQLTLDLEAYITTIITKDARFSNPLAWQTSAVEIKLLPPHLAIHVKESKVNIIGRDSLLDTDSVDSTALIDEGIEYITRTLHRLASNTNCSHSLLLSGGVDSRAVLGLVLAAGAGSKFSIRSNDPRNYKSKYSYKVFEEDFFISYALGKHFGLNWLPPRSTSNLKTSLEEGLRFSQPTSSNFSYAFPASTHHTIYSTPEISLRGGGGEPIKGAGFLSLEKQVQNYCSQKGTDDKAPYAQFQDWFINNAVVDNSYGQYVASALEKVEPWLTSESFDTLMPSYYQHSRNRTHFGHSKFSATTNLLTFQPLSNSYFYAAAAKHAPSELRNYKIARQIFATTEPSLLSFPFEDPEATDLLSNDNHTVIPRQLDILDSHFRSLAEHKPTIKDIKFRGAFQEKFPSDKNSALISLCRTVAIELEDAFPEYHDELRAVHRSVLDALVQKTLNPNLTLARMMSARDIYSPSSLPGIRIIHTCNRGKNVNSSIAGLHASDALPHLKTPSLFSKPPIVLNPQVRVAENRIFVEAHPEVSRPASLEFAFYLLKDGKAVQRVAYSRSESMAFDLSGQTHLSNYSIRCYARHQGTIAPCAITTIAS
ncbi:hypothetical protein HF851_06670 [Corynebacterium ammoniagenes]|uniref:hypothetical protein n=1 Tax=Corynebacterium ammoniagenes TaxID=1697 RepID=UPI0014596530|nr:hypothetical protein [Corynebacterium ammoniagenes]NMF31960.1 hypothetical protein [Corynebacterium ammoniagenes]